MSKHYQLCVVFRLVTFDYFCCMKRILSFLGLLSFGVGVLGAFLPLLPTTPFLLLSAALFAKSNDRLYKWLMNHELFGSYIHAFRVEKAIPLHGKVFSIGMLWSAMLFSIFFALSGRLYLQIMLVGIGIGVTIYILSFKTKR